MPQSEALPASAFVWLATPRQTTPCRPRPTIPLQRDRRALRLSFSAAFGMRETQHSFRNVQSNAPLTMALHASGLGGGLNVFLATSFILGQLVGHLREQARLLLSHPLVCRQRLIIWARPVMRFG